MDETPAGCRRFWKPGPDRKLPWLRLLWLGLLAAALSFLVLYFGGFGLKAYHGVRFDSTWPESRWWDLLRLFSLGGAVAIGTLTLCWRLIHRVEGQSHSGTALVVVGVVLFGFLVWPTPWTYRQFGCTVFQINRIMGHYREVAKMPSCEPAAVAGAAAPAGN